MKVLVHENYEGEEYVEFNVHKLPSGFSEIIARIQCVGQSLLVKTASERSVYIQIEEIYYLETIDNMVYVYLESGMPCYIKNQRLSDLEDKLDQLGFTRISKTTLVHLDKIQSFSSAGNGRQRATLDNGEDVVISRQYVARVLERLNG